MRVVGKVVFRLLVSPILYLGISKTEKLSELSLTFLILGLNWLSPCDLKAILLERLNARAWARQRHTGSEGRTTERTCSNLRPSSEIVHVGSKTVTTVETSHSHHSCAELLVHTLHTSHHSCHSTSHEHVRVHRLPHSSWHHVVSSHHVRAEHSCVHWGICCILSTWLTVSI